MEEHMFIKKSYKCNPNDFYKKIDKLKEMISIYNNKEYTEIDKAYQLFKIYNKVSEFEQKHRLLLENGQNDSMLEGFYEYIPILSKKLNEYKKLGYEEDFAPIRILERKMVDYEKTKTLVFAYIESEHFIEEHILDDIGVTSLDFERHIKLVKSISPKLYNQYLEKKAKNLILRYDDCINSFKDIANAIETGYFNDGTKFSLLEFWARVPLKENYKNYDLEFKCLNPNLSKFGFNFINRVRPFVNAVLPQKQQNIILNFIIENRLGRLSNTMTYTEIRNKYRGIRKITKIYTNENNEEVLIDFDFTEDGVQDIIDYMKLRKMPLIHEIFEVVLSEYITGNITKDIIEKMMNSGLNRKKC